MVSQEQQDANEHMKRVFEAEGKDVTSIRNHEGGIDNLVAEKNPSIEGFIGSVEAEAEAGQDYRKIIEKYNPQYQSQNVILDKISENPSRYLSELIQQLDHSPWYKRAWNKARCFFSRKSYEETILENIEQKISKNFTEARSKYRQLRKQYEEQSEKYSIQEQKIVELKAKRDKLEAQTRQNNDPMLAVQKNELLSEIEYQHTVKAIARAKLDIQKPQLERLNRYLLGIKNTKLFVERIADSFYTLKNGYSLSKCSV